MKVVYVLAVNWGGIPHYTAELANAVSKYADVVVLKPKDHNDSLFSKDIEVIHAFKPIQFSRGNIKKAFSLRNLRNMFSYANIKLIDRINPDIIHFPELYPYLNLFVCLYKLSKRHPIVHTSHSPLPLKTCIRLWTLPEILIYSASVITKRLVKVDKIFVHTQEAKNILIRSGINPEKIEVIPHGVYTLFKKYKPNNYEKGDYKENCILLFGQIGRNKGVDILLRAVPMVLNEINNAKFIIAGEGNISIHFKKFKDYEKYKHNIEIYNKFIPNDFVSYLFHRAKVVVLPYKGKGKGVNQSGVLTIALSFGKPVIATHAATTPEIIKECGIMIQPNDAKALANAIITILKNDKLRKKMSRNALKKAEELSWDNIAKMHMKVYEEVLNERRGRS